MTFEPSSQKLAFVMPSYFIKAELIFTAVSNFYDEVCMPILPNSRPRRVVSTSRLGKGQWRVCLNWFDGKVHYFYEKQIVIT